VEALKIENYMWYKAPYIPFERVGEEEISSGLLFSTTQFAERQNLLNHAGKISSAKSVGHLTV
jgi:hypothetical protein